MDGSAYEPIPEPTEADAQMHEATQRLREQAWMFAPLTSAPIQPEHGAADDAVAPVEATPARSTADLSTSSDG